MQERRRRERDVTWESCVRGRRGRSCGEDDVDICPAQRRLDARAPIVSAPILPAMLSVSSCSSSHWSLNLMTLLRMIPYKASRRCRFYSNKEKESVARSSCEGREGKAHPIEPDP